MEPHNLYRLYRLHRAQRQLLQTLVLGPCDTTGGKPLAGCRLANADYSSKTTNTAYRRIPYQYVTIDCVTSVANFARDASIFGGRKLHGLSEV